MLFYISIIMYMIFELNFLNVACLYQYICMFIGTFIMHVVCIVYMMLGVDKYSLYIYICVCIKKHIYLYKYTDA